MSELWRPLDAEDRAFLERSRRWALPVAGALGFALLALFLWAVAKITEMILHAMG